MVVLIKFCNFLSPFLLLLFIFANCLKLCANLTIPIQPDNIFTSPSASFRSILLNTKLSSLYVGARGHLFRLWLYNINDTSSPTLYSSREFVVHPNEREECLRLGNNHGECDFWVRQIFQRADGSILLCSSQAMKPQLGTIDGHTLRDIEEARTQIGICSQHEGLNITALYTETGNPDGLQALYSGIATGQTLENHLIYRPPLMSADGSREVHPALRTSIYDNTWLNEPQFVGSFSIGPHVFFFFRELLATDCFNCPGTSAGTGKGTWVSRVARICKSDLGGRQVLKQFWTSFVKARLNCSLPGFSFDQIQGVARVDWPDESGGSSSPDTIFYATFSAAEKTAFQASAICAFPLSRINQLFDTGLFLEQSISGSGSWWNPTPADQVPQNRPGSCQPDSRQLTDEELHFAKSHLLMAEPVQPLGGEPLWHHGNQMLLSTILVDPINGDKNDVSKNAENEENQQQKGGDGQQMLLLFAYSPNQNSLLKLLHRWPQNSAHLLAQYQLPMPAERVHSIAIFPGEYIYMSTETKVSQFRIGQCAAYGDACVPCIRDPLCSWSIPRRECFPMESAHGTSVGWLTAGEGDASEALQRCQRWAKPKAVPLFPGDSTHLECQNNADGGRMVGGGSSIQWTFNGQIIPPNTANRIFAQGGGLVLLNVSESEEGIWTCQIRTNADGGQPLTLAEYALIVDGEDCAKPKSVEQFKAVQREWCRRMDAYRSNLSKWQNLYESGPDSGGDGWNCPREKQLSAAAEDQQKKPTNIR